MTNIESVDASTTAETTKIQAQTRQLRNFVLGVLYLLALSYSGVTGTLALPEWGWNWEAAGYVARVLLIAGFVGGTLALAFTIRQRKASNISGRVVAGILQLTLIACLGVPFFTHQATGLWVAFGLAVAFFLLITATGVLAVAVARHNARKAR